MQTVVFGGRGLIGSKIVEILKAQGHDAVAVSRNQGVDAVTGEGLENVLKGAEVIIDAMDSPSFEDAIAKAFFTTGTGNIIAAAKGQPIKHYIALSVVGTHNLQISGYFQGKLEQENLIKASGMPYTIARATQFFEFAKFIAQAATEENIVRLPSAKMQPIAAIDVAQAIADIATGHPYNDIVDIAGPEQIAMSEFARRTLAAEQDGRNVVTDESALYVQTFPVNDKTLTPGSNQILGNLTFDRWLSNPARAYK